MTMVRTQLATCVLAVGALNIKPIRGEGGKEGPSSFLQTNEDTWPQSAVCSKDKNATPKGPTATVA